MMIHELKNEGLSISEIARKLGINRKTVRKYLQCERNDVAAVKRQPRASKLDSYRPYLCARLREHPQLSAKRLLREIRQHGYRGGYSILADYVHTVRPAAEVDYEIRFETPPGWQAPATGSEHIPTCCSTVASVNLSAPRRKKDADDHQNQKRRAWSIISADHRLDQKWVIYFRTFGYF